MYSIETVSKQFVHQSDLYTCIDSAEVFTVYAFT